MNLIRTPFPSKCRPRSKKLKPDYFSSQPPQSGTLEGWRNLVAKHVPNSSRRSPLVPAGSLSKSAESTSPSIRNSVQSGGFDDGQESEEAPPQSQPSKVLVPGDMGDDSEILAPPIISVSKVYFFYAQFVVFTQLSLAQHSCWKC